MQHSIKVFLLQELTKRQTRNSSYSLRAFARDLNIGTTTLSDVLSDKRQFSATNLNKVMQRLMLSPIEKNLILEQQAKHQRRSSRDSERMLLDEDTFRLIADWHYLAILNLAKIRTNKAAQPHWISKRIGIKPTEAEEALSRLLRLGLVKKKKDQLIRTAKSLTTSNNIPSEAIRKHHSQNLYLAENSLHHDSIELRDFGSVTMSVNPEKLPKAKEILLNTRKKIASLLGKGEASEVYTLSFQLFPLTRKVRKGD